MKKILSISLVLMMVLALALTGCGGNSNTTTTAADTTAAAQKTTAAAADKTTAATTAATPADELVTIDWYNGDGSVKDKRGYDGWLNWTNEYVGEKINVNINYHPLTGAEYEQKVVAALSAGQPVDIAFTSANTLAFAVWQSRDTFAPLNALMEEYAPETLAIVPDYVWEAASVDGEVYAMPTYKDMTTFGPMFYNETMMENAGLLETIENLEWYTIYDYIEYVYDLKEYRDAQDPSKASLPIMGGNTWDHVYFASDQIVSLAYTAIPGTTSFVGEDVYDGDVVFSKYASSEYEKKALMTKQLVDDVIMPYDMKNLGDSSKTWWQDQVYAVSIGWGDCSVNREQYLEEFGFTRNMVFPAKSFTGTAYIQAVMQAIISTSQKQEAAMKFLNLLWSDYEVSTSYHFGAPEEGWKKVEQDGVTRVDFAGTINEDPSDRGFYFWYHSEAGNLFTSYLPLEMPDDFFEVLDGMNQNTFTSTNLGFMVDSTPFENEVAAISAVIAEYDTIVTTGMLPDVASTLTEFNEKLAANGSEKVITEVQAQLDAWKSAN